jgi:hypothetical protein
MARQFGLGQKRLIGADDDPLLQKVEPIVWDIWAKGIVSLNRRRCIWMFFLSLLLELFSPIAAVAKHIIPTAILLGMYFYFSDMMQEKSPYVAELFLVAGVLFIYLEDIKQTIIDILLKILVVFSGGRVLRWLGRGYQDNSVLRHKLIVSKPGKALIALSVGALPRAHQRWCDHIMDLYLDSNDAPKAQELETIVETYWIGESTIDHELESAKQGSVDYSYDNEMFLLLFSLCFLIGLAGSFFYGLWVSGPIVFLKELVLVGGFRVNWFDSLLPAVIFWILFYGQYLKSFSGICMEVKRNWVATQGVKNRYKTLLINLNYSENLMELAQLPFWLILMQGIAWLVTL